MLSPVMQQQLFTIFNRSFRIYWNSYSAIYPLGQKGKFWRNQPITASDIGIFNPRQNNTATSTNGCLFSWHILRMN